VRPSDFLSGIVSRRWFDTLGILMHIAAAKVPPKRDAPMLLDDVKTVVGSALQIASRVREMDADTQLLGAVPELDSIAVVNLITALEEHFGIAVADDEIGASTFETLGSLTQFIERKLSG
jgi:acyl carrier protein